MRTYAFIFVDLEVEYEDLNPLDNKKYLVISNHVSKLDSFLITTNFRFNDLIKLLPFSGLTADKYLENLFMRNFLYYFCCCFSTKKERNKGKPVLEVAKDYININRTIFIFPEGTMNKKGKYDKNIKLGVGAIYLERENPDLYLIPVKIEHFGKRKIKLTYKKPFRHKNFPKNLYPLIEETMKNIYE